MQVREFGPKRDKLDLLMLSLQASMYPTTCCYHLVVKRNHNTGAGVYQLPPISGIHLIINVLSAQHGPKFMLIFSVRSTMLSRLFSNPIYSTFILNIGLWELDRGVFPFIIFCCK